MKLINRLIWMTAASVCLLAAQEDPPGRVARLSYTYGSVSFQPAGVDDWFPADFNRPLTTGDHVFVDPASTAELQIGGGALLLGGRTAVDILNLDDSNVQLRLSEGTLLIRVRSLGDQNSFEVDTPNLAFSLLQNGDYRIAVNPDTLVTAVTVKGGEGQLNGPDQAFTVHPGEQVQVAGADQPSYQRFDIPPPDTLDNFNAQREQREEQLQSARYCSRDMVGYQDLDQHGTWRSTPDYGMVWVPNGTPVGWAPYHFGHWVWVDPWGWTWVDDAPWGFAPFHYGRWAYVGGAWGWIPGPVSQRAVYAPALVAWVGGDAVSGGIGWFALGPHEVFVPSYHTSPTYVTRLNVSNTVIVNNVNITNVNITTVNYVNRSAPGAVMAVQRDAFVAAKPVQSATITVRPEAMKSATVVATAAVAPTRASVTRAPAPGANVPKPAPAVLARPVVAKKTPPPPPVPFAQKQSALASNGGRPLDKNQVQQLRQAQPAPRPLVKQVQAHAPAAQAPAGKGPAPSITAPPTQRRPVNTQAAPPQPKETTPPVQRRVPPPASSTTPRAVEPTRSASPEPATKTPPPNSTPPRPTEPTRSATPEPATKTPPPKEVKKDSKTNPKKDSTKKDEKKIEKKDNQN